MRTAWKIALSFLIWPVSAVGQNSPPSGQPASLLPTPAETENLIAPSDTTATPDASQRLISGATQTHAFLPFRPLLRPPIAPGYAPLLNISAGFSVVSLGMPSSGHAALSGTDAGISLETSRRLGVKLDLGYANASNAFSSGRHIDVLTYLVGPVLFLSNSNELNTFAHVLVGGARVAGPFSNANGVLNIGHVQYPAWAVGGGAEYRFSPSFGYRVSIDYMRTHFFNPLGAIRGQNDIRIVNSIVYYGIPRRIHR